MPAWLSSLRKTVPASFRSTQLRRLDRYPFEKKKKQATANTGEKKEEREGGKKESLTQNSIVFEHVTEA